MVINKVRAAALWGSAVSCQLPPSPEAKGRRMCSGTIWGWGAKLNFEISDHRWMVFFLYHELQWRGSAADPEILFFSMHCGAMWLLTGKWWNMEHLLYTLCWIAGYIRQVFTTLARNGSSDMSQPNSYDGTKHSKQAALYLSTRQWFGAKSSKHKVYRLRPDRIYKTHFWK